MMRTRPTVGPLTYLLCGLTLFAVKFAIDHTVATHVFARDWSIYNYLLPNEAYSLPALAAGERVFFLTMIGVAFPFIGVGIALTTRRLRDAGLPCWPILLFFVPFINLLFFALLSFLPSAKPKTPEPPPIPAEPLPRPVVQLDYALAPPESDRPFSSRFPRSSFAAGAVAILLPIPFAAILTYLAARVFRDYGWGIFIGLPFVLGMMSSVLYGYRVPRGLGACIGIACLSVTISGAALITFAIEGLGCLIMLAPLAYPIAILGATVGWSIQSQPDRYAMMNRSFTTLLIALPLLMAGESFAPRHTTTYAVTTTIEVNAPPARVWRHVVSFRDIPKPTDWVFRAGVAYPVRARIIGAGFGAIRRCEFSTGAFIEPITAWEEPARLAFSVTSNPPPMKEWSPFEVHPPHLKNFLVSHAGEFKLTALADGRTRLQGTTWYEHRLFPESYWRLWSDAIIHRIHRRVLDHVKSLSESPEADEAVTLVAD